MNLLRAWLAGLPAYLWSGWGAIASLCLLLAAWEAVSLAYGPLVMPDPRAAFATLWGLIDSGAAWPELAATAAAPPSKAAMRFSSTSLVGFMIRL